MTERDNQDTSPPQRQSPVENNEGTIVKTQAVFVNKLYKMLEDTSIQELISWSENGDLFSVSNPTSFSKIVLPQYFKHNNWQSFVRQLNMYGFHKVNDMIHSNLTSDSQTWEFKHPHFKRGEIDDLQHIKRKSTKPSFSTVTMRPPHISRTPSDGEEDMYGPMYKHILHIEDRLHHVTQSCEILRNESNSLRSLVSRQDYVISEFASLLGDVIHEGKNLKQEKKESIINRLKEFQQTDSYAASSQFQHRPLYSPTTTTPYIPKNRLLGFGKESHLLNPEPATSQHRHALDDEEDIEDGWDYNKKRRMD